MVAGISFTIYRNFFKYVTYPYYDENGKFHTKGGDDPDYSKALKVLNNIVKDAIKNKELEFTYNGKPVEITLPIEEYQTGNIFDKDSYYGYCWEGIDICCTLPIKSKDFDSSKLIVEKCPYEFDPESIISY